MALYQPTNVIPSSYTKGTVDAKKKMEIAWQVNGNSAMTAFQIDFYLNDYASTYVTTTGKKGATPEEQKQLGLPFYGTDRFGRPQFFTWSVGEPWNVFDGAFANGNEYKYKITQFFKGENSVVRCQTSNTISVGNIYYFKVPNSTAIVYFSVLSSPVAEIKNIYYSYTNGAIWVDNITGIVLCGGNYVQNGTIPNGAIEVTGVINETSLGELFVSQTSSNIVVTRDAPILTIDVKNKSIISTTVPYVFLNDDENLEIGKRFYDLVVSDFSPQVPEPQEGDLCVTQSGFYGKISKQYDGGEFSGYSVTIIEIPFTSGSSLTSSVVSFTANYIQKQDVSIRWIRWQVATANNGQVAEIIADTGDIYTSTLNYEYNGFFNGQKYAIRAIGKSESGQDCDSGWIFFNIDIQNQGNYSGNFTIQCLNKENATLLQWEGVEVIPPTVSPQGYEPVLSNGSVTLNNKDGATEYSVAWDKTMDKNGDLQDINFEPEWTTVCKWKNTNNKIIETTQKELQGIPTLFSSGETTNRKYVYGLSRTPDTEGMYPFSNTYDYPTPDTRFVVNAITTSASEIPELKDISIQFDNDSRTFTISGRWKPAIVPPPNIPSAIILNVTFEWKDIYITQITETMQKKIINAVIVNTSPETTQANINYTNSIISVTLFSVTQNPLQASIKITYETIDFSPQGKLISILPNQIILLRQGESFNIIYNNKNIINIPVPDNAVSIAIMIAPAQVNAYFYATNYILSGFSVPITYTQQPITSVSIYGGDSGATVDSVSVYQGDGSNILSLYENPDFEPVWNSEQYKLYMTANFNGNLEGGTGTATGAGFRVYRQEVGKNILTPIATVPSTTTSVKDYGIVSRKAYKYSLYAYDNNGAFMNAVENEKVVATCFKNYSLLVCDYDEENDEYHVRKQYLFALNLSAGSVGNNNSPTLNANFTKYPTRMPSTQNYASGTLSGLIGAIYTVPALIEQIGNYKRTAKPSTIDYFDNVDLEKELYDLSTAPYQLFLRDMKGRLRMIATNSAITMTTNIKQKQQSISISFPWVEIGDASDVTIIQTPDDYGWNNDNQVLDVSLDVDVSTGELSATYPFPYNGTKFYLTGVNKEMLTAKTPLGITPAQFNLSEVAKKTTDGEVTATVKVNTENK